MPVAANSGAARRGGGAPRPYDNWVVRRQVSSLELCLDTLLRRRTSAMSSVEEFDSSAASMYRVLQSPRAA